MHKIKLMKKAMSDSVLMTRDMINAEMCDTALDVVAGYTNIPIIVCLKPFTKRAMGIRERNLMRNTIYFMQGFQTGDVECDKLKEYREKLHNDQKYFEEEVSRILILLDNTVESIRAKIIGCLYMNLVNQRIDYTEFCEFCELTNRLFKEDFKALYEETGNMEGYRLDRMVSMGLLKHESEFADPNGDGNLVITKPYKVTRIGKQYGDLIEAVVKKEIF